MKSVLCLLFAVSIVSSPLIAAAQAPQGFDPAKMMEQFNNPETMKKMEAMAAEAEKASKCMEGIDRAQLDALQKRAEAASREIEGLCAAGKTDEALRKGLSLSRELNANATVKKMRDCSKGMTDAMKDMPWAGTNQPRALKESKEPTRNDICS